MPVKIKFFPYEKFRMNGFKNMIKDLEDGSIILIDAKLKASEEASIIEETMKKISSRFTGIELGSLELRNGKKKYENSFEMLRERLRDTIVERMTGKKSGMTVIGSAKVVRRIKKNPEEFLLYM